MTRRPLCMLCLILMLSMCATDWAGIPLIRGNPLPENAASWIEEHPQATLCGEVIQTTENEFSQSVYLSNAYLIYQSQKLSIENVKVFLKQREEVPAGTVILVSGKLKRVEEKRNPGEFDSQQYYASQHIYYLLNNADNRKIRKLFGIQAGNKSASGVPGRSPWENCWKRSRYFSGNRAWG